MELKIVLKVQMNWNCQKCRTEALKAVADADGVNSVALEGENKEKVVVIGDGVDPVKLTTRLRKKVGQADVISFLIRNPADKEVLKVQMNCEKCRTEALKAVAVADRVNSVALVLEGEDKDKVMVIGDGVDAVKLTSSLRKKVDKHADIISVGPVKVQN